MRARSPPFDRSVEPASNPPLYDPARIPRQRRPRHERHAGTRAVGVHLPLFLAVDEVVVVLHRDELRPAVRCRRHLQFRELPGEHRRSTQVEDLAGLDHVVQRLERLLDGRLDVTGHPVRVPMDDEVVDVVEAGPPEACIDAFGDVLAGQAALVGSATHGHGDLGGKHVLVARQQVAQERAHDLLAGADAVHVRAVEVEEALVEGRLEDRAGGVGTERPVALVTPPRLAEVHRAETQFRDAQAAVTAELDGVGDRRAQRLISRSVGHLRIRNSSEPMRESRE